VVPGNSPAAPFQFSLDYQFTPPSEKGAILILPEGATSENLLNLRGVTEEAQANAESWYRYAYLERGRTAINNDSLFLITGFRKASSWAIAAFSDADRSAGLQGRFTAGNIINGDVAGAYSWQVSKSIHCRVGPKAGYDVNKLNQTIAICGFKIALRKSFFDSMFSRNRVKVEVTRELPGTGTKSGAYVPRPISSGSGTRRAGKSQIAPRKCLNSFSPRNRVEVSVRTPRDWYQIQSIHSSESTHCIREWNSRHREITVPVFVGCFEIA